MATNRGLNPFYFSKPVPAAELIDRESELDQLRRLAEGGHNARLTAPRRYGKTTLIKRLRVEMEKAGVPLVYVNFYGLLSVAEAATRIETAYRSSLQGPVRGFVVGAIRTLRPKASIPGTGLSVDPNLEDTEVGRRLASLLNLPARIMKKHGTRTLVVFDEFQDVLQTKPPIDGLIRSVIEQHEDEASYVFAGSHPGMMAQLFAQRGRPFYSQARSVVLSPLPSEALSSYVHDRFSVTGRDAGEALDLLLQTVRGHPQRAMLVAHFLWEQTADGERADEVTWQQALQAAYFEVEAELVAEWNGLNDGERRTVAAITATGGSLSKATLESLQLARSTAESARDRLLEEGVLVRTDGALRLVDPLMELWISQSRQGLVEPSTGSDEAMEGGGT